jgi:hypothetical protein
VERTTEGASRLSGRISSLASITESFAMSY